MEQMLNQLAKSLGLVAFTLDAQGKYHIRMDSESLFLYQSGSCLVIASFLNWYYQPGTLSGDLLKSLLRQVTSWSRLYPQGLALNHQGQLLLEARQVLTGLDLAWLEKTLTAHVGILEQLKLQLSEASKPHQWNQAIWR